MRSTASDSAEPKITIEDLREYVQEWILDSQLRQHTKQTILCRKDTLRKIFWFFEDRGLADIGSSELKQFFLYCAEGHNDANGRWGNPRMTTPLRPVTIHGYYRVLRALFNYLSGEGTITHNPMARIKPPVVRNEMKQPVSDEHLAALIKATKLSPFARRDAAMLILLLDTGLRASEFCGLHLSDVDFESRSVRVMGKGNKFRTVYFGLSAKKALTLYLRGKKRQPNSPLFLSSRHKLLTASGLFQCIKRLAAIADIPNPGVHALRRTFAVNMLKAGANVFTVQTLMGHSDLEMTRRYCNIAQADIENQHRQFSPADLLTAKGR